jgi:anti-sigma28 factor (negative regulator of flagellin synthesis)
MQISSHETQRVLRHAPRVAKRRATPIRTLADLARRYEVDMDEVRAVAARARAMDDDPVRERRLRDLAQRIADGTYSISSEQIVDLAVRRAIVDQIR